MGDRYRVGIIAAPETYHGRRRAWFFSLNGIWNFVRDLVGYVYSKVWMLVSASKREGIDNKLAEGPWKRSNSNCHALAPNSETAAPLPSSRGLRAFSLPDLMGEECCTLRPSSSSY
jgi:hypothetical protein